ncbi:MAG: hypothetical protein R3F13_19540 [Prosthecobacter sp.]
MPDWDSGSWDSGSWDQPSSPPIFPTAPKPKRKLNRRTMASNPTPDNPDVLRALADRMADGCATYEGAIGILQNTEAAMRAAIAALSTTETQLGFKKLELSTANAALEAADEGNITCINNCKLRLKQLLGERWSTAWEPTGFPDNSTKLPTTQDKRFTLLDALKNYFTTMPASESADMGATAALCTAAWTAMSDARQGVADAADAQTTALAARDDAVRALRKRVRGLISELETLIADDDPRWEAFGLNIPANPAAPEGIATLTLTTPAAGKIHAEWSYATRMSGTRLLTKRIGLDDDFVNSGTADGLEKTLSGFTAGQTVEIKAVPYNDGGDGPASPTQSIVVT